MNKKIWHDVAYGVSLLVFVMVIDPVLNSLVRFALEIATRSTLKIPVVTNWRVIVGLIIGVLYVMVLTIMSTINVEFFGISLNLARVGVWISGGVLVLSFVAIYQAFPGWTEMLKNDVAYDVYLGLIEWLNDKIIPMGRGLLKGVLVGWMSNWLQRIIYCATPREDTSGTLYEEEEDEEEPESEEV